MEYTAHIDPKTPLPLTVEPAAPLRPEGFLVRWKSPNVTIDSMTMNSLPRNRLWVESRAISIEQFPRRKEVVQCAKPVLVGLPIVRQPGTKSKGLEAFLTRARNKLSEISSEGPLRDRILSRGKLIFGPNFTQPREIFPLISGQASHVILVSLSYADPRSHKHGYGRLNGTKSDFALMLRHFGFNHKNPPRSFVLLNDFETEFEDATGDKRTIPPTDTSRKAIRMAIQRTMKEADANGRVIFYFGGHGLLVDESGGLSHGPSESSTQAIMAGDGKPIHGSELRSWFCSGPHKSVSVTALFDACHSGGILGLSYAYEIELQKVQPELIAKKAVPLAMLEISAARKHQLAFSNRFDGIQYGQMSLCLIKYLEAAMDQSIEGLVHHVYKRCDPSGEQIPLICCSRKLKHAQDVL